MKLHESGHGREIERHCVNVFSTQIEKKEKESKTRGCLLEQREVSSIAVKYVQYVFAL